MSTSWTWPAGTLVLAATPIGNLGDATPRLIQAMEQADIIAAEDTRKARALADLLGVETKAAYLSCYEHNERDRAQQLATRIAADNARVLFISDAGMPSVSDPGFRLAQTIIDSGLELTVLPGASAVPTALALSGLETDRFCFEGFIERKASRARARLESLAGEPRTMVFFESARRVHDTAVLMAEVFGSDRRAAMCRELTKLHEEVVRGTLADIVEATTGQVKGEIVLVVAGAREDGAPLSLDEAAQRAADMAAECSMRLKEACKKVAASSGLKASDIYSAAQKSRN